MIQHYVWELDIKFKKIDTQNKNNQKFVKNDNEELVVENHPKKKQTKDRQTKFNPSDCPNCKRNIWIDFIEGWFRWIGQFIIDKQKPQIDKKILHKRALFLHYPPSK